MAKSANALVLDGLLDVVATATSFSVCSTQPTTRTEADSTYMLAKGSLSGSFTKANDGSGRKVTVPAQTGASITNSGTAQHVALYDGTKLIYVTTVTSQALVAGGTVNVGSWDISVAQPT